MGKAIYRSMKTIKTMRHDDHEPYTVGVGPDQVKVKGTRTAARYAYDRGLEVVDCEGTRYVTALECVTWGRPILMRA
jgi:hypothetical protein